MGLRRVGIHKPVWRQVTRRGFRGLSPVDYRGLPAAYCGSSLFYLPARVRPVVRGWRRPQAGEVCDLAEWLPQPLLPIAEPAREQVFGDDKTLVKNKRTTRYAGCRSRREKTGLAPGKALRFDDRETSV